MASTDAYALQFSDLNRFLFADVGVEANGTVLSVVSVFARLGSDPWTEAGRLARLPADEATRSLAGTIASMPSGIWPLAEASAIAARLIALLPRERSVLPRPTVRRAPFVIRRVISPRVMRMALVAACIALVASSAVWMATRESAGSGTDRIVSFESIPVPPRAGEAAGVRPR